MLFSQILRTLGTESSHPSNAAQCVAAIAQIELPLNQWPDLIQLLVTNCTTSNVPDPLKEACIEALGYIVEDIVSILYRTFELLQLFVRTSTLRLTVHL